MGFGKFLLGGLCAAGAIIAAPVVLPMAAGAAVIAGSAMAGAAATAGAAVAGAATAAGAAAASSAAGVALGGAMATVGGGVASAATAVGITSVATIAGTGAGATAVGAISTAGAFGLASSATGVKLMADAKHIVDDAESRYNAKKNIVKKAELKTNNELKKLGEIKLTVWNSFLEFYEVVSKIKNCKLLDGQSKDESLKLSLEELSTLNQLGITAGDLLKTSASSLGAGALAGLATYGGTMAMGTASTGTAIAGLSGVAATNATLATLGGGALSAGGLGMAGGTAVLGGLVAAPALAVSGLFLAVKGNSDVGKARKTAEAADEAIEKFEESLLHINEIKELTVLVSKALNKMYIGYRGFLNELTQIVNEKKDFSTFTEEEIKITELCILSVKVLKKLTTTDLLVKKGETVKVNKKPINDVIVDAQQLAIQIK